MTDSSLKALTKFAKIDNLQWYIVPLLIFVNSAPWLIYPATLYPIKQ
ncbi:MAG: hypothetical protein MJB14_06380 [Spirochaetes bacterium]|nr:hypothetical protein [Spirochaetota bacterium]